MQINYIIYFLVGLKYSNHYTQKPDGDAMGSSLAVIILDN